MQRAPTEHDRMGQGLGRDYASRGDAERFGPPGPQGRGAPGGAPGYRGRDEPDGAGGAPPRANAGPKNWTRSDERIHDDVCHRLASMPALDVSDVSVEVRDGHVFLDGTVPERRMKHLIEDVVDRCLGVREIENRLRLRPGEPGRRPGAGLGDPFPSSPVGRR
ncbi:MAG TPA: BON domain-containing protein [Burkholderiaceae bacterium]|nr:BON domain-containing protein [Burkholderiaceae bacterium]